MVFVMGVERRSKCSLELLLSPEAQKAHCLHMTFVLGRVALTTLFISDWSLFNTVQTAEDALEDVAMMYESR